ncbi:unnamed protein product [Caenorhabditis nigoni]
MVQPSMVPEEMVPQAMVPPATNNGGQELVVPQPLDPQFVQKFMAQLKTRLQAIEYDSLLNQQRIRHASQRAITDLHIHFLQVEHEARIAQLRQHLQQQQDYEDALEAGFAQIRQQQQHHQQEVVRLIQGIEHPLPTPQATPAYFPEMRVQTPPQ